MHDIIYICIHYIYVYNIYIIPLMISIIKFHENMEDNQVRNLFLLFNRLGYNHNKVYWNIKNINGTTLTLGMVQAYASSLNIIPVNVQSSLANNIANNSIIIIDCFQVFLCIRRCFFKVYFHKKKSKTKLVIYHHNT